MAFAGVNTTPVKKVLNPKSALSCRLCGASVANGGYYSLTSDTAEKLSICSRISSLFGVEENLPVGPRVLCKKCFRRFHMAFDKGIQRTNNNHNCTFRIVAVSHLVKTQTQTRNKLKQQRFTGTGWQDSQNVLALNKIQYPTCLLIT